MPPSMNACGPILVAMESKAGTFEMCNLFEGANMKPEFLAINPWHTIPSMEDGDVKIGESNAIMRYLAKKYMPSIYPEDAGKAAMIDFALDAFGNVYKHHTGTVYVAFGFKGEQTEEEQKKCNESYKEETLKWLAHFKGSKKFCGGDTPNLADYKAVPFLFSAIQPVCSKKISLEMPPEVKEYCDAFCTAVPSAAFLSNAGGYSIKEFAASKEA